MSLGGWLERWLIGDSKIKSDSSALSNWGDTQFNSGLGTSGDAVSGLQGDIAGYQKQLASGRVLPDSVYRAYDTMRGGIGDEAARSSGALQASIAQRRAASGGLFSDEAGAEYQTLGNQNINDSAFNSLRDVGINQAQTELGATQDLMSRLSSARNNILNYGEFQQQLGYDAKARGIANRITRAQAIGSAGQSAGQSFSSAHFGFNRGGGGG